LKTETIVAELNKQHLILKRHKLSPTNREEDQFVRGFLAGVEFCGEMEGSFAEVYAKVIKALVI
jgi:hypothetical protein